MLRYIVRKAANCLSWPLLHNLPGKVCFWQHSRPYKVEICTSMPWLTLCIVHPLHFRFTILLASHNETSALPALLTIASLRLLTGLVIFLPLGTAL